jgi:hypothetical protein
LKAIISKYQYATNTFLVTYVKEVKLSLYSPGQALSAPGNRGSQNFYKIVKGRWQYCQPYAPTNFISQEIPLLLISVRG